MSYPLLFCVTQSVEPLAMTLIPPKRIVLLASVLKVTSRTDELVPAIPVS